MKSNGLYGYPFMMPRDQIRSQNLYLLKNALHVRKKYIFLIIIQILKIYLKMFYGEGLNDGKWKNILKHLIKYATICTPE